MLGDRRAPSGEISNGNQDTPLEPRTALRPGDGPAPPPGTRHPRPCGSVPRAVPPPAGVLGRAARPAGEPGNRSSHRGQPGQRTTPKLDHRGHPDRARRPGARAGRPAGPAEADPGRRPSPGSAPHLPAQRGPPGGRAVPGRDGGNARQPAPADHRGPGGRAAAPGGGGPRRAGPGPHQRHLPGGVPGPRPGSGAALRACGAGLPADHAARRPGRGARLHHRAATAGRGHGPGAGPQRPRGGVRRAARDRHLRCGGGHRRAIEPGCQGVRPAHRAGGAPERPQALRRDGGGHHPRGRPPGHRRQRARLRRHAAGLRGEPQLWPAVHARAGRADGRDAADRIAAGRGDADPPAPAGRPH